MDCPRHPDAVAPEREQRIACDGIELCVYEWGDPEAAPILLAHGLWDTARGFDTLAPHLAEQFRVLAVDARGHGESERVELYSWPNDVRDLCGLIEWIDEPVHLLGHSRGGGQLTDAAALVPERVRRIVNIDGFGPPKGGYQRIGEEEWVEGDPAEEIVQFFDLRRSLANKPMVWRPRESFDELVERRAVQNPRLAPEWVRYFSYHCARETPDGWIWKVDPRTTLGFGPFDPDWIADGWRRVRAPLLAVTGDTHDAFGPCDDPTIQDRFRYVQSWQRAVVPDTGHFVHMEQPAATARLALDFLTG